MNSTRRHPILTLSLGAALASTSFLASCKLPTSNNWRTVQNTSVVPALMDWQKDSPAQVVAKSTPPPRVDPAAPLKVDPVMPPKLVDIPVGEPVAGRPGYVFSPYTSTKRIVDVREFKAGEEVRCPITLKSFVVPDFNKAGASTAIADNNAKASGTQVVSKESSMEIPSTANQGEAKLNATSTPAPAPTTAATPPAAPANELPFGRRVAGRPGFVYSPYASQYQLVDVAGIAPGVEVRCPYTNKLFRVPEPLAVETSDKPAEPKAPEQPKPEEKKQDKPKEQPKPAAPAPAAAPQPAAAPHPEPKPAPTASAPAAPATENLPTASWAQKEKGLVQSPFGQNGQLVDVTGKAPGSKVVCPFSGKPFLVPTE